MELQVQPIRRTSKTMPSETSHPPGTAAPSLAAKKPKVKAKKRNGDSSDPPDVLTEQQLTPSLQETLTSLASSSPSPEACGPCDSDGDQDNGGNVPQRKRPKKKNVKKKNKGSVVEESLF